MVRMILVGVLFESASRSSVPGGPRGLPLLGHLLAYLPDKLHFLTDCAAAYGDVVRLRIGEPTLLLSNPGDIQHVLTGNPNNYGKTWRLTNARGQRISGTGLHTSFGAAHLKQRRLMQPMFQRRIVETFAEMMQTRVSSMLQSWSPGITLDLRPAMESLALSIMLAAVFGPRFEDARGEMARAITARRSFYEYVYGTLLPFPDRLPHPAVLRYNNAMKTIDRVIAREMHSGGDPAGWAAMFARTRYPDGTRMNLTQLRDEILTMLSTGYETAGDALTWTLYLLATHPEAEANVLREIGDVLGGCQRAPTADDVSRLKYTRMVLDESMRLYPPTWIYIRMALGDDRLPASGAAVARGTKLYLCQWVMHRHPKYFPEPDKFRPERFADSGGRPRFAYFPFGAGQRRCLGEQFALLECVVAVAMILQKVRLELTPGQLVEPHPGITLRPKNGIQLRLHPRAGL